MMLDWVLWVPANFLNLWVMPIKFQTLFSNVVVLMFNTGLSYIANKNNENHEDALPITPINLKYYSLDNQAESFV